jgi:lipid II isoglutaminyl synthase (glutamine-hydrolysing)
MDTIILFFDIIIGKAVAFFIRAIGLGHGFTWPGEIALRIDPRFMMRIMKKNDFLKTVVIVGTNGKTTSAKMARHVLVKNGYAVIGNETGANLKNGIVSALIGRARLSGRIKANAAIFEVDENVLPLVLPDFHPDAIMVLNLFRDQLDRYGEVNTIAIKWREAFEHLTAKTTLIMNGNDPQIAHLGKSVTGIPTIYFGLDRSLMKRRTVPHEADSLYCPGCGEKLSYNAVAYSHIGDFACPGCGFTSEKVIDLSGKIKSPLLGLFNRYNTNAVALMLKRIFDIPLEDIERDLSGFAAAFGRQEIVEYKGRKVIIQLSKNPTGFNQSIEILEEFEKEKRRALVLLNDRIPDGRDVSWIWDVDFELLANLADTLVISGDRAYDMGIRLTYAKGRPNDGAEKKAKDKKMVVVPNLEKAVESIVEMTPRGETFFILPTYSAMLEIRNILTGDEFRQKTS